MHLIKSNPLEKQSPHPPQKRLSYKTIVKGAKAHLVDVVMINSREQSEGFYLAAIGSILHQNYKSCGLIQVDNLDKALTIGEAWNLAINYSKARWILFVGDDDFISNDLIHSMMCYAEHARVSEAKEIQAVTTGFTAVDLNDQILELRTEAVTGMWRREYLLEHPFDELLKSQVDTNLFDRTPKELIAHMYHHYGYHYRQHSGMVSGQKTIVIDADKQ